jgi:hypothetical protein
LARAATPFRRAALSENGTAAASLSHIRFPEKLVATSYQLRLNADASNS